MADYSGNYDPVTVKLTDTWLRKNNDGAEVHCWSSYKDFAPAGPCIEVPRPMLGLLIDGHREGYERNKDFFRARDLSFDYKKHPRITWNGARQRWQLRGGYHMSNPETLKWLQRHGWIDSSYRLLRPFDE